MNIEEITKCAIAIVGVTQLLKNVLPLKGKIWTLLTLVVGIVITIIQSVVPTMALDAIIAVSGATIFYDTIYQTFEKIFKRGKDE